MRHDTRLAALLLAFLAVGCSRTEPKVPRVPITSIQVDPAEPTLAVGRELLVTAQGVKANGLTEDLSDCQWSVADEGFVRLEAGYAAARLTGLKPGETRLLVTARGIVANVPLRVLSAEPLTLTLQPASLTLAIGESEQVTAIARMSDGSVETVTEQVDWSSKTAEVADVQAGLVTGRAAGSTRVRAKLLGLEAFADVKVSGARLVRLDVQPPQATLPLHTALPLQAIAVFDDATTSDVTALAAWSSGAPEIVRMNGASAEAVGAGQATVTARYGEVSGTSQIAVTTAELRAVEVAPAQLQLAKGTSAALQATALFADDTRLDVTLQATWTSSDAAIASTNDTVKGAVKAESPGVAIVTAELLGISGGCEVTVTAATLTALAVTPPSVTLAKGTSASFVATGTYSDQSTQDLTALALWNSSDEAVATVSDLAGTKGLAIAMEPGRTTITAALEGLEASAALEVTAAQVRAITIDPAIAVLAKGTELQLAATAEFTDGTTLAITDQADWSSSDNAIASVTTINPGRGLARGVSPGEATVTATFGGKSGAARLTVTPATLAFLSIAPIDPSVAKGTELAMRATGRYSDGRVQDVTTLVTWSVSDASIARVSNATGSNGLVTALAAGTTTLRAALDGQAASTTLTVTPAVLVGFIVSPTAVVLEYQGSQQLTATATYSDGSRVEVTASTDWTSADPSVATVSSTGSARGLVRAAHAGQTTVTASFGGKSATVSVTVREPRLASLEVRPASLSLPAGRSGQLEAFATYADGAQLRVTARADWSSSSAAAVVGSGAEAGRVSARSVGSAIITASLEGVSGTAQVTVTSPLIEQLTISPTSATLAAGAQKAFTVRAFFSDGSSQEVTTQASFTSSDEATCGLDENVALGVAPGGPVTITARYGGLSATARVTVIAPTLRSLAINPNALTLSRDQTGQLRAVATYTDNSTRDVTSEAVWTSSNGSVCTVSTGLVRATGSGSATITATLNGQSASASIRVESPTLQRIALTPPDAVLRPNLIYPFLAFAIYSDGSTREVTTASTWTSDNPAIAEPSNYSGYWGVWAKGAGTATVRASWNGLTGSTSVQVYNSTLAGVEVSPAQVKLPIGVAAKVTGVFVYSDGWASQIQNPQWTIADGRIARVDANGVVTGLAQGTTTVILDAYDSFGLSYQATAAVVVTATTVRSIELSVPARMVVGLSQRVRATGILSDGSSIDLNPSVVWSSTDTTLASVAPDLDGAKVTARAAGSVRIGASFGAASASAQVTLANTSLNGLTLSVSQPSLAVGASSPVSVEGVFADGTRLDLTESVTYESSAPDVVHVSDGMFGNSRNLYALAMSPGSAALKASLNGKSATIQTTVRGATLSSIALAVGAGQPGTSLTVTGPGPHRLRAVGTFSDGSTGDVTIFCTFSPSELGSNVVATVSNVISGQLTVVRTGTETVRATYAPSFIGQPTRSGSASLTVR